MESTQGKINKKTASIRRKLFDNNIQVMGTEFSCVRLKTTENMYEDTETLTVISNDQLNAVIKVPSDIPISRFRSDASDNPADDSNVFFYDILPIDVYTRWKDDLEKGDILIFKIFDETNKELQIILRIAEIVTKFSQAIVWKRSLAAPYNGDKTFLTNYL